MAYSDGKWRMRSSMTCLNVYFSWQHPCANIYAHRFPLPVSWIMCRGYSVQCSSCSNCLRSDLQLDTHTSYTAAWSCLRIYSTLPNIHKLRKPRSMRAAKFALSLRTWDLYSLIWACLIIACFWMFFGLQEAQTRDCPQESYSGES